MSETLFVRCEGSGWPCHDMGSMNLCSMCGNDVPTENGGEAIEHDRADILAMLDNGYFDEGTS